MTSKPSKTKRRKIQAALGERVRLRRVEMGISQERLGELCALHRTYIGGVERGERNVSLVNIVVIARALGVDPAHLVEGIQA